MSRIRDIWLKDVYPDAFKDINVQYPVPSDGDSLYVKDIDVANSDNGGFSGVVTDYFDSLKTVNSDASGTNPKTIMVWFNRTVQTHAIGFGCDDLTKSFSNIVFKALGSGEEVRFTKDESADSTKRNSYLLELPQIALNGFIVEFHTADEVGLSNLIMFKTIDTHATISAQKDNGDIIDIGATNSGNLKVTDAENGLAIAQGDVQGKSSTHKFGAAPDFDSSDGQVTAWDGANDALINAMNYTYSSTANIDSISSSNAGDTMTLRVSGLDASYNLIEQDKTLQGQATVLLDTPLIRVFRIQNIGSVDVAGIVYCYINGAATVGGVPSSTSDMRAIINNGNNQTLMAVFTVPDGFTGYIRDWYASAAGANRNTNYIVRMKIRQFGEVFATKHISSIADNGTSYIQHKYEDPEVVASKADIEMTIEIADAGISAASVAAGFDIVLVDDSL